MTSEPRTRDPEAKRTRLLEASLREFAEVGLAGARVERIARRAKISPGLVYSFYAGKQELFDGVFDEVVHRTVSEVPIDADDLPEYAARLHDANLAHPEVVRFLTWYQRERGAAAQRDTVTESMREKVRTIAAAQERGILTGEFSAEQVLALVLTIATMWVQQSEDVTALVPPAAQRQTIKDAVARLTAPQDVSP
ncbi:TetR family transcriptional regulator [Cellulosimicrobium sp. PMB13]|uniref:TetR family transcriptional regulator n=1 Tax=Cellulosimicrobium sp. PMB13 TaxID=3120158 RepID=UPI003F4B77EC